MLYLSPVYSQASGSIAGLTYSHNRGGQYVRQRVKPTDPASERQSAVRAAMQTCVSAWGTTLTADQKAAWRTYAANVAMTNKLGQQVFLTGQQHFIRCNVPRVQAAIAMILDAPEIYDLGTYTPPTLDAVNANQEISIAFENTDDWAKAEGGYLLIFGGMSVSPGKAFYKGPFRFADIIAGAAVPPTSPATVDPGYLLTEGNLVWVQARVIQVDGRMSGPILLGPGTVGPIA